MVPHLLCLGGMVASHRHFRKPSQPVAFQPR